MIKPRMRIDRHTRNRWFCSVEDREDLRLESDEDWIVFGALGIGNTIEEAYIDWLKDVESSGELDMSDYYPKSKTFMEMLEEEYRE